MPKRVGRAIFVEPGARHSSAPETIAFLEQQKVHDPSWIERDIVLEEIEGFARAAGLTALTILPMPHPGMLIAFTLREWQVCRAGDMAWRREFAERLTDINYNERLVFYCERPR